MNPISMQPAEQAEQRNFNQVNKFLLVWFAFFAVVLMAMSAIPALQSASVAVQPPPAPRYAYCTKAWRQQQLPANMQATFEDWCEHRPGAINLTGR